MCNFFSARCFARGIYFCETWSHEETGRRLGIDEDYVDVEYDPERGFEVHEPFKLPSWFNTAAVAVKVKELYEQLKNKDAGPASTEEV